MDDGPGGDYQAAVDYLVCSMKEEQLVQLADLLREAMGNGYGVVKIVVVDKRVEGFRLEKMYK